MFITKFLFIAERLSNGLNFLLCGFFTSVLYRDYKTTDISRSYNPLKGYLSR